MNARAAAKPTPGLILGGEPRANLLPPEVGERIKARRTRSYLMLLVAAVLLATVGGYAFASLQAMNAQAGLAEAQARTAALIEEKSTYADVISATNTIALITSSREDATSTEVIWSDFLVRVGAAMPGVELRVNKIAASSPPPWVTPLASTGPLRSERVATFVLRLWTPTPPEATALYRLMSNIEGVSDLSIDLVEKVEDPVGYMTTITLNLDADTYSDRWPDPEAEDASSEEENTDD